MAEALSRWTRRFQWRPFTDFVYTTYAGTLLADVQAGNTTFVAGACSTSRTSATAYATDQGFTVIGLIATVVRAPSSRAGCRPAPVGS